MSHRLCLSMLFILNSNIVWAACDSAIDVCLEQQPANAGVPSSGNNDAGYNNASSNTDNGTDNSTVSNTTNSTAAVNSTSGSTVTNVAADKSAPDDIDKLVDDITADLKARRLTKPAGNNALTKIQHLKRLSPTHDYSINGRRYVARIYLSLARSDVKSNRLERAAAHYRAAVDVDPAVPGLKAVDDQINRTKAGTASATRDTERTLSPANIAESAKPEDNAAADPELKPELKPKVKPELKSEVKPSIKPVASVSAPVQNGGERSGVLITPVMIGLPAGSFVMGSESGADNEKPVHQVKIEAFSMSRYEITREQFYAFKTDTGASIPRPDADAALLPVSGVTAQEALAYARWLSKKTGKNYRLPTEREWEYAVRAGTTSPYHSGDTIFGAANCLTCLDNIPRSASPVGSFEPNGFGLYDMHGNVSEWTSSCITGDYFAYDEVREEQVCPKRVVRGGSWRSTRDQVRSSYRAGLTASGRSMDTGFRVVHDGL